MGGKDTRMSREDFRKIYEHPLHSGRWTEIPPAARRYLRRELASIKRSTSVMSAIQLAVGDLQEENRTGSEIDWTDPRMVKRLWARTGHHLTEDLKGEPRRGLPSHRKVALDELTEMAAGADALPAIEERLEISLLYRRLDGHEKALIEALEGGLSMKAAAGSLGIPLSTAYHRLNRIREKFQLS